MELFSKKEKTSNASAVDPAEKSTKDSSHSPYSLIKQLRLIGKLASRFQDLFVILLLATCLAVTALRMLGYLNPAPSEEKIQENLSKIKQVRIDSKAIDRIKQLSDTKVTTNPQLQPGRNNPFAE